MTTAEAMAALAEALEVVTALSHCWTEAIDNKVLILVGVDENGEDTWAPSPVSKDTLARVAALIAKHGGSNAKVSSGRCPHCGMVQHDIAYAEDRTRSEERALAAEALKTAKAMQEKAVAAERERIKSWFEKPPEAAWGGLARDLVMWCRTDRPTGAGLYELLRNMGRDIPGWLRQEIDDTDFVPPKGTVAVCIARALAATLDEKEG